MSIQSHERVWSCVAAEGPPHVGDNVGSGVGPGQILLAGEQASEEERSGRPNTWIICDHQV